MELDGVHAGGVRRRRTTVPGCEREEDALRMQMPVPAFRTGGGRGSTDAPGGGLGAGAVGVIRRWHGARSAHTGGRGERAVSRRRGRE